MPTFRLLTWNVNGESLAKARCLAGLFAHWRPDVVMIQEANSGRTGEVAGLLESSRLFRAPIGRAPEGGGQGRAYLMAVAPHIAVVQPLSAVALAVDPQVQDFVTRTTAPGLRRTVVREVTSYRNLGIARLALAGREVRLATWHAPRGPSLFGSAPAVLPGGANPDALLLLEHSAIYDQLIPKNNGLGLLAGDLNVRQAALGQAVVFSDGSSFEPFAGWTGFGNGLDFILSRVAPGRQDPTCQGFHVDDCSGPGGSDHAIVAASVHLA